MSWLDDLIGIKEVLFNGVALVRRARLNFIGAGVSVSDNAATGTTDVTILAGGGGEGSGDVVGPAGAADNAVARFDSTTGKVIQNSLVTIDDLGNISLPASRTVDGRDVSADGTKLDRFPSTNGSPGQVLTTDGGGTYSWQDLSSTLPDGSESGQGLVWSGSDWDPERIHLSPSGPHAANGTITAFELRQVNLLSASRAATLPGGDTTPRHGTLAGAKVVGQSGGFTLTVSAPVGLSIESGTGILSSDGEVKVWAYDAPNTTWRLVFHYTPATAAAVSAVTAALDSHTSNTSNPHNVTPGQIGAALAVHGHVISDVGGLQTALNSKQPYLVPTGPVDLNGAIGAFVLRQVSLATANRTATLPGSAGTLPGTLAGTKVVGLAQGNTLTVSAGAGTTIEPGTGTLIADGETKIWIYDSTNATWRLVYHHIPGLFQFILSVDGQLGAHLSDTDNPHDVTPEQIDAVHLNRTISTTAPLTGGGSLAADRTISLIAGTVIGQVLRWSGSGWLAALLGIGDVDGLTAALAAKADSSALASHVGAVDNPHSVTASQVGAPPTARTLTAGNGLTGGGDLSTNRSFAVQPHGDGSIAVSASGVQVGVLANDTQHGQRGGGNQHAAATTNSPGFMSATDKTNLERLLRGWRAIVGIPLANTAIGNTMVGRLVILQGAGTGTLTIESSTTAGWVAGDRIGCMLNSADAEFTVAGAAGVSVVVEEGKFLRCSRRGALVIAEYLGINTWYVHGGLDHRDELSYSLTTTADGFHALAQMGTANGVFESNSSYQIEGKVLLRANGAGAILPTYGFWDVTALVTVDGAGGLSVLMDNATATHLTGPGDGSANVLWDTKSNNLALIVHHVAAFGGGASAHWSANLRIYGQTNAVS